MNRCPWWPCAEMQEVGKLFLIKIFHSLPKPFYYFMVLRIWSFVFSMSFPVLYINERNSIKQHFHFIRFKYRQVFSWNYTIYSFFYEPDRSRNHISCHHLYAAIKEEFTTYQRKGICFSLWRECLFHLQPVIFLQLYVLCPCSQQSMFINHPNLQITG